MNTTQLSTIDPEEVEHFSRMAEAWWNPHGAFRPLHQLNPTRIDYITQRICAHRYNSSPTSSSPLQGLEIVDIGCGGGLVCEPLARLGANITGIDASEKNIGIASTHAQGQHLPITYRHTTAETLAAEGSRYDVVLALEIIEHVQEIPTFLRALHQLTKPNGLCIISTLNRTFASYAMAIIGAEYVLRWLPKGTHTWSKFIRPNELASLAHHAQLTLTQQDGLVYAPLSGRWSIHPTNLDVNYIACFTPTPSISA
jgi:2-polyprenyl-6-hydroxyphenyl methylase/3-demethylubiquinone-9 3-methyltransferase